MSNGKVSQPSRYKIYIQYRKLIQLAWLQLADHLHEGVGYGHFFPFILHQVNIEDYICDISKRKTKPDCDKDITKQQTKNSDSKVKSYLMS
jgi:hypothetical protein